MYDFPKYSAPWKLLDKYYYYHNSGLQPQSILYVKDSLHGEPRVFLDPNQLVADGTASLASLSFSEDGKYCAYAVSHGGSDWNTLYIKNAETLEDLPYQLEWLKFSSTAWTHDNKGFFYSRYPAPEKDDKDIHETKAKKVDKHSDHSIYYHVLGTDQSKDVLVFSEPSQPDWLVSAGVTEDGRYLLITLSQDCSPVNRLYAVDLRDFSPGVAPKINKFIDNFDANYSLVTNEGSLLYLMTNLNAPNNRIVTIDLDKPGEAQPLIAESEHLLEGASCVNQKYLVLNYLEHVANVIQIHDIKGKLLRVLPLPGLGTVGGISGDKKYDEFFFRFGSFLHPGTILRYTFGADEHSEGSMETYQEAKVEGFDPTQFVVERLFYNSKDGTRIPMFFVRSKDFVANGEAPCQMYGYGGFSISITPFFSVSKILWILHCGGTLAFPSLRGGNEYGLNWHNMGILEKKQNVFDDFIAAGEYLCQNKLTKPSKLAIMGGSNGGLLVTACVNQRPDLFAAGVAQVPVTDMLRFHKFTIGHMWVSDFGCADKPEQFEYIIKYSPLHTVKKGKPFPALLITTADRDDRVVPLHSYKLTAELQYQLGSEPYQKQPLLLRVDVKAGHGAGKPTQKLLDEACDTLIFMSLALDIEVKLQ